MAAEVALDRLGRQSNTSHFFGSVPAVCQMVAAGREVGFWNPLQVHPSIYPSIHQCVSDWLGDTSQELRFSVLEMKTVQIVLNSSLRRIMGETLVLMSDNSGASQKNKSISGHVQTGSGGHYLIRAAHGQHHNKVYSREEYSSRSVKPSRLDPSRE